MDILGQWLSLDLNSSKLSTVYRLYKACLNYGVKAGSPRKAAEAEKFQGVFICPTRIQILIARYDCLRNQEFRRRLFVIDDLDQKDSPEPWM